MTIRVFFALPIREAVARRLADHADTLCSLAQSGEIDWVDSDNYHLTLGFLSEITLDQVCELEQIASVRLAPIHSFQVHLSHTDYLEINPELSLLAARADHDEPLLKLHKIVSEIADEIGIDCREKGFEPHVTLGSRSGPPERKIPKKWPTLDLFSLADTLVLYQSRAENKRCTYTPLFELPLLDMT